MLVWFAVRFLLALAFEGCADLPDAAVRCVFDVAVEGMCDWDDGPGFGRKAVDLFLDCGDELCAVRGFEGVDGFDLLGIAGVVFGGEECVDGVLAHDVRVGRFGGVVFAREDSWRWVVLLHDLPDLSRHNRVVYRIPAVFGPRCLGGGGCRLVGLGSKRCGAVLGCSWEVVESRVG